VITIEGNLVEDAEYRRSAHGGEAVVLVRIETGGSLFEAEVPYGNRPEAHVAAQDRARSLRRGFSGRIVCAGLWHVSDHGRARFLTRVLSSVVVEGVVLL